MRPIVHISVWVLTLCMMFISSLDAGRFILLDENGNPIEGEPTCQRCEDYLVNCPSGFFCACGCTEEEREDERKKRRRAELQNLFNENNAGLKDIYSECMIDIYFGNGIWNDRRSTYTGMRYLFGEFYETNSYDPKKHHFGIAYNRGYGQEDDIIETYSQLQESGQISNLMGYFESMYKIMNTYEEDSLTTKGMKALKAYVEEKLPEIKAKLATNYGAMFSKYQKFSFNNGHRVLLVAHSQGNLFGNAMYSRMTWEKDYFSMIGVATPASYVAGGGPHIIVQRDPIRLIPNNLYWNTPGSGHEFIETYLTEQAGDKLNRYLISASNVLNTIPTQWKVASQTNEKSCEYRVSLEHKHKELSALEDLKKVFPFDIEDGKVYTASDRLVMGQCGGTSIKYYSCDNSEATLCYELNGTNDMIEVPEKDFDTKSGFKVSLNDGTFISYTEDTFKTIAHDESKEFPYANYTFDVKYDENSTDSWTAIQHQTQQWDNMCGDVLRIGNKASPFQNIHRGINLCVEINEGTSTCFTPLPCCFRMFETEQEEIEAEAAGICSYSTCQ